MEAKLIRIEETEEGTVGVLILDNKAFCCTLELPDRQNKKNISCIPTGTYMAERVNSPKYGETFEIVGVDGRTHILIHAGNTDEDTLGCILVGQYFGKLQGERAVLNSGKTFKKFLEATENVVEFQITITEV